MHIKSENNRDGFQDGQTHNKSSFQTILVAPVDGSPLYFNISTLSASGTRVITGGKTGRRKASPSLYTVDPWHPLKDVA
jgi:hypothetical protein